MHQVSPCAQARGVRPCVCVTGRRGGDSPQQRPMHFITIEKGGTIIAASTRVSEGVSWSVVGVEQGRVERVGRNSVSLKLDGKFNERGVIGVVQQLTLKHRWKERVKWGKHQKKITLSLQTSLSQTRKNGNSESQEGGEGGEVERSKRRAKGRERERLDEMGLGLGIRNRNRMVIFGNGITQSQFNLRSPYTQHVCKLCRYQVLLPWLVSTAFTGVTVTPPTLRGRDTLSMHNSSFTHHSTAVRMETSTQIHTGHIWIQSLHQPTIIIQSQHLGLHRNPRELRRPLRLAPLCMAGSE